MRTNHKLALKKIKQQILAFCLRHNLRYEGKSEVLYCAPTKTNEQRTRNRPFHAPDK